ncbi:helix-turn-helix domain-containing protein [Microbispora sp. KK1-11]|uniref:helix-turn-helix domain-containing protein n=1 Tax=Microbispora sp. KK1-11 TaxID=2053005 RepID=UPI00115792DF|nr:helix-turn-helix domain-containing protein [Microbispora sp. KK1-11]TQS30082.1 helix-turn-helix domain-containing protein [Microbispora sp. KK1-11]
MPRNRAEPRRERLLNPKDVADMFGYEPKTVIGWARKGRLPYIRTPGGQYRFRPADVDDLLSVIGDESDELPENATRACR